MESRNIDIIQGFSYTSAINVTGVSGLAIDLSDFIVSGDILTQYGQPPTGNFSGIVISPASGGQIEIYLSTGDTAALPPTQLIYRVNVISPSEQIAILFGLLNIYPSV